MNITILGGGTAGWLTSLLVKEFYPQYNITVIESDEIGILGAGEGTVPHFISVLDSINIPISELIKHCDATLKNGIRFTNWNGDDKSYFHSFNGNNTVAVSSLDRLPLFQNILYTTHLANSGSLDSVSINAITSSQCRVPFSKPTVPGFAFQNPILSLQNHANFAVHFNARKLAKFLRSVAESRNIQRIEGRVVELKNNKSGNVSKILLEEGATVDTDFVFDCSGFARLVVGKHYNTKWESYADHLPLDTALPFFIPHSNSKIRPETESIAMKYGWVWKIPVQDRYGCGYVFDSKFITEEQALSEVEEYFGTPVESPRTFKFAAGSFKDTYVKNCLAVGLAQSFVEPLEATSILISCMNLIEFLQNTEINNPSAVFRQQFNQRCRDRNNEVVEFLYLHYLTKRKDSAFWQQFRTNTKIVASVEEKLNLWQDQAPGKYFDIESVFSLGSWLQVANGLELLNSTVFANKIEQSQLNQRLGSEYMTYIYNLRTVSNTCMDHQEFLDFLKQ